VHSKAIESVRNWAAFVLAAAGWLPAVNANAATVDSRNNNQVVAERTPSIDDREAANTIARAIRESADQDSGCRNKTDKRDSNVCAQWKAADAGRDAADYALWSAVLTALGTVFLVWTLWETRKSAVREQRAYIRAELADGVVLPGQKIVIGMNLINYGKTPARKCAVETSAVVRAPNWDWADEQPPLKSSDDRPNITLHPDCPYRIHAEMDDVLPQEIFDAVMDGRAVVFARGRVIYEDVFRRTRTTTFQVEFHGVDSGDGTDGRLRIAARGNDFT
jgi:hypothetical protein